MSLQDQSSRLWPFSNSGTSVSLAVSFLARATEGVGPWTSVSGLSNLTIVFPQGRDDATTMSAIREQIVQHAMNSSLSSWWAPKNTTPEAALRAALGSWLPATQTSGTSLAVTFNGQFGPVLVC